MDPNVSGAAGGRVSSRALEASRGQMAADGREAFHSLFHKFLEAQVGSRVDTLDTLEQ